MPQPDTLDRIKRCIRDRLEMNLTVVRFTDDVPLFAPLPSGGLELDSLASLEIVVCLSQEFRLQLADVPREAFHSVRTLGLYIDGRLASDRAQEQVQT